jgi:hypothetical protein
MPRVRCVSQDGVELLFYSNDHDPPHFHAVRRDHWHYRVRFLLPEEEMLQKKSGPRAMPGNTKRQLLARVAAHRLALLEEWEATRSDD